jgi:hypothetical protein
MLTIGTPAFAGIVEVGQAVGETRTQMEQRRCRSFGHPCVTVRRSRHHAFEQAQHRAHAGDTIQGADEVHLGRPRIGEADIHSARHQRPQQRFGAVHVLARGDDGHPGRNGVRRRMNARDLVHRGALMGDVIGAGAVDLNAVDNTRGPCRSSADRRYCRSPPSLQK